MDKFKSWVSRAIPPKFYSWVKKDNYIYFVSHYSSAEGYIGWRTSSKATSIVLDPAIQDPKEMNLVKDYEKFKKNYPRMIKDVFLGIF